MFICIVIASRGNGGLEKHVRDLSRCLLEHGHRVLIVGDSGFVNTIPDGIEVECINMRLSRHNPWLLFQLYLKLRQYNFDVIHVQASKAASMLLSIKILLKPPMVVTVHNIKSQFKLYQRFDYVICVSHHLATLVKTDATKVIYNGIQNTQSKILDLKTQYDLPKDKPVICAVGRLVTAKGFDVLLEAINGIDVSVIVAGEGPQREWLEKRVNRIQSNSVVRLICHYDHPSDLMSSVDGVVISSRREGFSYVFNEALMCGANIISTDVPVANEVLPSELIVPVEDAIILREKLITYLKAPEQWTDLMRDAHKFALQHMTIKQMTEKTISFYLKMLYPKK